MREDIYSMTKSGFHEAMRQAKEQAWDEGREYGARRGERGLGAGDNPYRKSA